MILVDKPLYSEGIIKLKLQIEKSMCNQKIDRNICI